MVDHFPKAGLCNVSLLKMKNNMAQFISIGNTKEIKKPYANGIISAKTENNVMLHVQQR